MNKMWTKKKSHIKKENGDLNDTASKAFIYLFLSWGGSFELHISILEVGSYVNHVTDFRHKAKHHFGLEK